MEGSLKESLKDSLDGSLKESLEGMEGSLEEVVFNPPETKKSKKRPGKPGSQEVSIEDADLLGRSYIDTEPERLEWVIPDFLARGQLSMSAGDAGSGKSLFLLDLIRRASAGEAVLGGYYPLDRPIRVLYVMGDLDPSTFAYKYVGRLGMSFAGTPGVSFLSSLKVSTRLREKYGCSFDLANATSLSLLERLIKIRSVDLVVLDTLRSLAQTYNENNSEDMGHLMNGLSSLASRTRAHIHLVHHFRKQQVARAGKRDQHDIAGASVLQALSNFVLGYTVDEKHGGTSISVLKEGVLGGYKPFPSKVFYRISNTSDRISLDLEVSGIRTPTLQTLSEQELQVLSLVRSGVDTLKDLRAELCPQISHSLVAKRVRELRLLGFLISEGTSTRDTRYRLSESAETLMADKADS